MNCDCPIAGHCDRYKRRMTPRQHLICRNGVLTPDKCEAYRRNWAMLAKDGPPAAAVDSNPPLNRGPGTELHNLIDSLGIKRDASCGCEAMRQKMDVWGTKGCREHTPEILDHLEAAYQSTNWLTILRAAPLAAAQGIYSLRGLVDEAIRRAEERAR